MNNPSDGWPRISPAVFYNDAAAAIDWLTRAFGFAVRERIEDDQGRIVHSQLVLDGGLIMVGQVGLHPDRTYPRSPLVVGGANTQSLAVYVPLAVGVGVVDQHTGQIHGMRVELPFDHPFDYQLAMDRLAGFRAPRNKLRSLCLGGDVVRVRKGLYVAPTFPGRPPSVDPLVLAPLVYGPSYVSLETALAWHGLIPERVDEITSVTCKRARLFRTPLGRFSYRPVNEVAFGYGVGLQSADGGSFFLAEPEKALCDRVACVGQLRAQRDIPALQ